MNLPAEPLGAALQDLAKVYEFQLLFHTELVQGLKTQGASGSLTSDEALTKVLTGTGLSYKFLDSNTITVYPQSPSQAAAVAGSDQNQSPTKKEETGKKSSQDFRVAQVDQASAGPQVDKAKDEEAEKNKISEIVVTGTHIRGATASASPITTLTREDFARSGYSTVEEVLQAVPQNFSQINPTGQYTTEGGSALATSNGERASGIDLRGLGPQSTLTLIDGRRQAGAVRGQVVDISAIPLSMIDHIDVVNTGSSAIYGSDAVGGVVNLVTRQEFEGAEIRASYGASRNGGARPQASLVTGHRFDRGGFVFGYDYQADRKLDLIDTGLYVSPTEFGVIPLHINVIAPDVRHSGFLAGHFFVTDSVDLFANGFYTAKKFTSLDTYLWPGGANPSFNSVESHSKDYNATGGARFHFFGDWLLSATASTSASNNTPSATAFTDLGFFSSTSIFDQSLHARSSAYSLDADGPLGTFGSITPRAAIGAEDRHEGFNFTQSGQLLSTDSREVRSAYVEVLIPFIPAGSGRAQRLDLTVAGRYDHYDDFGGTFNPQVGLVYSPIRDVTLRGAYATAFRAPSLYDLSVSNTQSALQLLSDPTTGGLSPVLNWDGSNPNLGPEKAKTWSFGIDFKPQVAPWASAAITYFDIRYDDRIGVPAYSFSDQTLELVEAARYTGLINRTPSLAQLSQILAASAASQPAAGGGIFNETGMPWDPTSGATGLLAAFPGLVLFDDRTRNIATEKLHGIDFKADAQFGVGSNTLNFGVIGTWTFEHTVNVTSASPASTAQNEVGKPVGFRARASAGWSQGAYGVYTFLNYTERYQNPFAVPTGTIGSWTTVDMTLRFDGSKLAVPGVLKGATLSLSASNLLDRNPPEFLQSQLYGLRYDATNANPVGRYITLSLSKGW